MAGCIQVEFASEDVVQVQLCRDDTLAVAQRACQHLPQRADDDATPSDHHILGVPAFCVCHSVIWRVVLLLGKLTCRQDEAAAFQRDVGHRALPQWSGVDRRRAIDLGALGVIPRSHCGQDCAISTKAYFQVRLIGLRRGM